METEAITNQQQPLLYKEQQSLTRPEFMLHVHALTEGLPEQTYALNLCKDRGNFMCAFIACALAGKTNLLPSGQNERAVRDSTEQYTDFFIISDNELDYELNRPHIKINIWQVKDNNGAIIREPHIQDSKTPKVEQLNYEQIQNYIAEDIRCAIAFTSGSTGKPKANNKHWASLKGAAQRLANRFKIDSSHCLLATVPSQHMYGLEMTVMLSLVSGCSIRCEQPFFPADVSHALMKLKQGVLVTTPAHLRVLQSLSKEVSGQLHCIVSATAPLALSLAQSIEQLFQCPLLEDYGCTEAGSFATRQTSKDITWVCLEGIELKQVQQETQLTLPYFSDPVILEDRINIVDKQHFQFLGRGQDMVNIGGKRSSLTDLNLKLLEIEGIDDSVLFVPKDSERPAALVVSNLTRERLRSLFAKHIDAVFLPRPLLKVKSLGRDATGKLKQQALEDLLRTTRLEQEHND
ncbi:AMP-binding protein [Agaribacterium sp. ZY112]|uniref:AMP-binding protein n=1 Tax=Agaribacterium sp. ZY112 TaxID=3233574 RepID=UPI003524A8F6